MIDTIIYFTDTSRAEGATMQVLRHSSTLRRIDGYCSGANTFLQLHNSKTTPAANAIPLWSVQLFGNDGFTFAFPGANELKFTLGMFLALSTDETKYTADASGTKVSGSILVDDADNYSGYTRTAVGDYTTAVANLQVWADTASPTKALQRLECTNNNAAAVIFFVIARDATTAAQKICWQSGSVAAGASIDVKFGVEGLIPFENLVGTGGNTLHNGCTVVAALTSANTGEGLPTVIATTDFTIRATYKS